MSEQQPWTYYYAGYEAQIFHTDGPANAQGEPPSDWRIIDRASGVQVASGRESTRRGAREKVEQKLIALRATCAATTGSNPPINEDAT